MSSRAARRPCSASGLTLVELLVSAVILLVAIVALLRVYFADTTVRVHARNLSWAMMDVAKVTERLRDKYTPPSCVVGVAPDAFPPAPFASWDAWLASPAAGGGGGMSLPTEHVAVRSSGVNPLLVTIAVCWRDRGRVVGLECDWAGGLLVENDRNGNGIIESPAMISTAVTCRQ